MSKYSYEVTRLVNRVLKSTPEELMDDYGIELLEGGKVYDTVEDITFESIGEWAKTVVEEEEPLYEIGNKRGRFDDEDYY